MLQAVDEALQVRRQRRGTSPTTLQCLPLVAEFRFPGCSQTDWIELERPARESEEAEVRPALRKEMAVEPDPRLPLQRISNLGRFVRLRIEILELKPLAARWGDEVFSIWIPSRELRQSVVATREPGSSFDLTAIVGRYKGEWQLVVEEADWVDEN